jgi:hypothetical protein
MSDQESQLRIVKELASQLARIEEQNSKIREQQLNLYDLADKLAKKLGALGDHQVQLDEIENKLKELKIVQETLTRNGGDYLSSLKERCRNLDILKNRIDRKTWLYDKALRLIAITLIGLLLTASILMIWCKFPIWDLSSNEAQSTKRTASTVSSFANSTSPVSSASSQISDNVLLCAYQNDDPPGTSPSPKTEDAAIPKSGESPNGSNPMESQSALTAGHTDGSIQEKSDKHESVKAVFESVNEPIQGFDFSIEVKARRHAPGTSKEIPAPIEQSIVKGREFLSPDEAKIWSFAILALTVVILFGFAAFATARIIRNE